MTQDARPSARGGVDVGAYCRDVEAHLCRVNGGHLVRIVGPAFGLVSGWAQEGIPLRIVLHGVERTVARLTVKGPRRRPVRIEFCEADVRDAYDQWRKAVGVHAAGAARMPEGEGSDDLPERPSRTPSLPRHLERVAVRLSSAAATQALPPSLMATIDRVLRDVDACLEPARGARGDARAALIARLARLDDEMTAAASAALDDAQREACRLNAARELAPHKATLPAEAYRDAERALQAELARKAFALPQVRLDG